jgi:hypothetical protein
VILQERENVELLVMDVSLLMRKSALRVLWQQSILSLVPVVELLYMVSVAFQILGPILFVIDPTIIPFAS